MRNLLAAHPEVDSLPREGAVFGDGLVRPEEYGWTRMWVYCLDKIELNEMSQGVNADKIKRAWGLWLKRNRRFYLEKSISNSARMRWLDAHFENAYFISIVRNGYAVAEGIRRRAREGKIPKDYPIELCAKQWVLSNGIIDTDGTRVNRFTSLTYEHLTSDPVTKMREVFSFVGLPVGNIIPISGGVSIAGKYFSIGNRNAESISRLSCDEIAAVSKVAGQMLSTKGYEIIPE